MGQNKFEIGEQVIITSFEGFDGDRGIVDDWAEQTGQHLYSIELETGERAEWVPEANLETGT